MVILKYFGTTHSDILYMFYTEFTFWVFVRSHTIRENFSCCARTHTGIEKIDFDKLSK